MTLPQVVQDAVALADQFCGTYEKGFAVRNAWATTRAELHRLTEIAEGVEPLVIRLGEVTTKLEAANALLRDVLDSYCASPDLHARIQSHLQGAGDE